MISSSIFKAYDIRGLYPEEINEQVACLVGKAFVNFLGKRKARIVIGRDNRLSSLSLSKNLIKGMREKAAEIIDIGLATTPLFYFAVAYYKYDGGINVTASHNPRQYNGFKIVREKAISIGERSGLKTIQDLANKQEIGIGLPARSKAKIKKKNVIRDYVKFSLKKIDISKIRPLRLVVDTANAVPGILIPEFFKKSPVRVYHLFSKLDGNFPNHSPNPLIKRNLKSLQKEIIKRRADLGVAFDGDGDRIIFLDERGRVIQPDLILALMSFLILQKEKKGKKRRKILYDIRSSNIVKETIRANGGIPVISRVGHSFIKEKMRKEDIIFGGEFSGHYYSKRDYFSEAPFFVLGSILEAISQKRKSLSELISPFRVYFHSEEINFKVDNKKKILEKIEKKYKKGRVTHLDGLRIDFKDWWFNVRSSHTEPLLRLIIEAKTKKLLNEKKRELVNLILSSGADSRR